jgi:HemY protein
MWRIILFLIAVLALAFLCVFVVEQHGLVTLSLGSHVYEASLGAGLAALLVAVLALYLLFRLLMLALHLPFATLAFSRARRHAKASAAISKGLVAVASGDLHAAARHAQTAERLAGHEPLALLLKAQAAQLSGHRAAAKDAFARMAEIAETRGLGLRGLFVEARRRGDGAAAHHHAAQAARLDVFLPWAHEATLMAQCQSRDWTAALATLERNHRLGAMETGEMRRAKAALLAARGLDMRNFDPKEALQAALNALKIDPGLVPAAVTAASVLTHDGRHRQARRIIETAWRLTPHPNLVEAYPGLRPNLPAAERLKQISKLTAVKPEHEESRIALAQGLLAAREFGKARTALEPLVRARPTARICLLVAEIEEAEHGMTGLAREWLARAAHAPRDPAWVADGTVSPHWAPVVPESGRIGVLVWQHPPEWVEASPGPAGLPARIEAPKPPPPGTGTSRASPSLSDTVLVDAGPVDAHFVEAKPADAKSAGLAAGASARTGSPETTDASANGTLPPAPDRPVTGIVLGSGKPPSAPAAEAADQTTLASSGEALAAEASRPRIKPVAFPLERAPDDPGAGPSKEKGLWRRLTE